MKNKLHLSIYGYDPQEFLPIFHNGTLTNKTAFLRYKTKRIIRKVTTAAYMTKLLYNAIRVQ